MKNHLPEKFTSRMASMADLPRIHALEERKSLHYYDVPGLSLARLINEYETPGFEVEKSVLLVEDQAGDLAALIEVWDERDPPVHPYIWFSVDPDYEDQGLEDYLLKWGEERARQALERVEPGLRVAIRSHSEKLVQSSGKAKLANGFIQIRHSFRMMIDLDEKPTAPVWPEGVSLRLYDPELDSRTVYAVDEEAFQDHFGFVKEDPEEGYKNFMHHMTGDDSYDPSLWYLAAAGDEVIGTCICRLYGLDDRDSGWVSTLAVKRAWRRQGVAQALLQHAFGEYYRRGVNKVGLGVDAESLTGASNLYKKVGMYVSRQFDMYEKELRPGTEVSVTDLESSEE